MQNNTQTQLEFPTVMGQPYETIPDDLFIPPNALELCLETFSGPMDLLLYLIKKENINILDLDVSKITDQYIEYIDLMDALQFELAAEYLVMAATLAEIKSRMMLPQDVHEEEEDDPKSALIKRLQEYQRYKTVSEKIAILPRVDRDFFLASASLPKIEVEKKDIQITKDELVAIFHEVKNRPDLKSNHQIHFEELSTQERIQIILEILSKRNVISFSKTLRKTEGRQGVVVTFLASLELAKDGHLELIQNETEEIFFKIKRSDKLNIKMINTVEALLFGSGRPLRISEIRSLLEFDGVTAELSEIKQCLNELETRYIDSSLEVVEIASGYRLQIRKEFSPALSHLWNERAPRISKALMETISIIAYNQPVTRGDIEDIRGVSVSTQSIRSLLERNWIKVSGFKDAPGRPALYSTTKEFLDDLNLKRLSDLPELPDPADNIVQDDDHQTIPQAV